MLSVKNIGVNAHLLSGKAGYRQAGIHQYIAQVLHHLPADDGMSYIVYTQQGALLQNEQLRVVSSGWDTERPLLRILWEQTVWPLLARRHQIDLSHSMAFVTPLLLFKTAVVTVYDLSFIHYPERFPVPQRWYLTTQTQRSCRQAARVITISESSRQDVHQIFGVPLAKIDVIVPGVGTEYKPFSTDEVEQFRKKKGLPERLILHVGTLQPRKNIPILIDALAQMPDDVGLALVGGKGWLYDEIFARVEALGLQKRVLFTGYVPFEELPLWYNVASVFVFPSVYEGFGMPVVEAMACGTPVIASNASSIPEAVGKAGLLFDPKDVDELVQQLTAVFQKPNLVQKMRADGLRWAKSFSWQRAGEQTADVYKKALLNAK